MRFFDKVFNLLWLNILVIIFSIPVVTAGAAFTAMHYVLLRMTRNEEGYIFPNFWSSFKSNFKQATSLWIPFLLITGGLGVDVWLIMEGKVTEPVYKAGIYFLLVLACMGLVYIFPVLSHYDNTNRGTIKNAYAMSVYNPIKTLIMIALYVAPWLAAVFVPNFVFVCFFYGFTLPGYLSATLYDGVFRRFEKEERKAAQRREAEETEAMGNGDNS